MALSWTSPQANMTALCLEFGTLPAPHDMGSLHQLRASRGESHSAPQLGKPPRAHISPQMASSWTGGTAWRMLYYSSFLGLSGVRLLSFMALNFLCLPRIGGSTDPPGDSVGAKKVHQVTSELEAGMQGVIWVLGEGL